MNNLGTNKKIIYLDQNKWIDLAKAYNDRPDGVKFKPVLIKLREAISRGNIIVPLSSTHFMETWKSSNPDQRARLIPVVVEISQGYTIAPPEAILSAELDIAINKTFNLGMSTPQPKIIGRNIVFSFGHDEDLHKKLNMSVEKANLIKDLIDNPEWLARFLQGLNEETNTIHKNRLKESSQRYVELTEAERNELKAESQDMQEKILYYKFVRDNQEILEKSLSKVGLSFDELIDLGVDNVISFFQAIPSVYTNTQLTLYRNADLNKAIHPNDGVDLDFLSVVIPYTDIIVTEKYWTHIARFKKLNQKYDNEVTKDLTTLLNLL